MEFNRNFLIDKIGEIALRAMLYEVSASPKPGLVDRYNNGAHRDMDFFTFMASSAALSSGMVAMARLGFEHEGKIELLLPKLRGAGKKAEDRMMRATRNVNTQKGLLFAMGLACGVCGYLCKGGEKITLEKICREISEMTEGIVQKELNPLLFGEKERMSLTAGEKLYIKYKVEGIRGEVEKGLPTVRKYGFPAFVDCIERGCSVNDAALHALLNIMTAVEDTTILHRHDLEVLQFVHERAREVIDAGSVFTNKGRQMIAAMDEEFCRNNISPGGAADLLALSIAIYFWEQEIPQKN